MIGRFQKKPVLIEAVQWNGRNEIEIARFVGGNLVMGDDCLIIHTLEGDMKASVNDWIIKGVHGEFYPCKPDIFAETYISADETNSQ